MSPARCACAVILTTLALACAPEAPRASPPPVVAPTPPPAPPLVRAPEAVVTPLLTYPTLGYDVPHDAPTTGRDRSWVAQCDALFVNGSSAWIAARLAPAERAIWNAYCDPPLPRGPLPPPAPVSAAPSDEHLRREEGEARLRSARRAAAIRALTPRAARADAAAIDLLALAYLLTEVGYEAARENAWSCTMCELGPPNRFSPEDFARSVRSSQEVARARAYFERASTSADDAGWLAGYAAEQLRWQLGEDVEARIEALAARRPPEGVDGPVAVLATDSLQKGRVDRALSLLGALEAPQAAARVWIEALSGRPRETLRAAAQIAAPLQDALPPPDILALGVTAAELGGMEGSAPGPRDGEARVALAAMYDALETLDLARAHRWLRWIAEEAPQAAYAPAALEAARLLFEAEGGPRGPGAAAAQAPDRADRRSAYPLSRIWGDFAQRAAAAVAAAAHAEERATSAAQALGRRCLWAEAEPVRVELTVRGSRLTADGPVGAGVRACLEKLGPGYFAGIDGEVRVALRSTGVKR